MVFWQNGRAVVKCLILSEEKDKGRSGESQEVG